MPTIPDLPSTPGDSVQDPLPAAPASGRPGRAFARVLDLLAQGVLLVDGAGRTAHVNSALASALREDDERDTLLREMRRLALGLPRVPAAGGVGDEWPIDAAVPEAVVRETRTGTARYRLRAAAISDTLAGVDHPVVVTLERLTPRLPAPSTLMERFGLTACEAGVALLLVQGRSNEGVARKLGISPHTARHHTENVLLKLDVHARGEVVSRLLGTPRPSGKMPSL